ncbi:hypothetical protein IF1G_00698 [Cordyceps javanica]|uniref:Mmc protein n=1 Tax=Cordyceps javanica TaxID=43265 RepID=A0A545VGC0_9HYPO|nr:hypothetical protein IF1G_00698 [Cordyceps javanica]TQW11947.1 hypothetical protein IF2G_00678 [Cordyceps javanica]
MFTKAIALALAGAVAVQAGEYPHHHPTNGTIHTTPAHHTSPPHHTEPAHHTEPPHHTETIHTVTEVVDVWSTYCPEPTHLTMNNKTYTVTEACTYTITDCPCTVTKAVPTYPAGGNNNNNNPANPPANNNNNNAGNNNAGNNNNNAGNKGPSPTAAPPVVGAAGQNTAAYGMALAGAIAAAAIAL